MNDSVHPTARHFRVQHQWLTNYIRDPAKNGPLLEDLLRLDQLSRILQLATFPMAWWAAAIDAVNQGAYVDSDTAAAESLRVAERKALDAGVGPSLVSTAKDVATAMMKRDTAAMNDGLRAAVDAGGPRLVALMAFFAAAQSAVYSTNAEYQERSLASLLEQVATQIDSKAPGGDPT